MKRIIPLTPRRWLALEIFRRMKHERVEEHPLRQLFWECTLRCNVRCRHCGSDCKSSPATPDMPLQDFLKVLDSIATHTNPHDVFVIISGGEPTVREDLETCGKEISRRGYPWGMVCHSLGAISCIPAIMKYNGEMIILNLLNYFFYEYRRILQAIFIG